MQYIIVMRHGERRDGAVDAPNEADPPLTDEGRRQVASAADALRRALGHTAAAQLFVISSPFRRTLQTACELRRHGIGVAHTLRIDSALCEVYNAQVVRCGAAAPSLPREVLRAAMGQLPVWGETMQMATERYVAAFLRYAALQDATPLNATAAAMTATTTATTSSTCADTETMETRYASDMSSSDVGGSDAIRASRDARAAAAQCRVNNNNNNSGGGESSSSSNTTAVNTVVGVAPTLTATSDGTRRVVVRAADDDAHTRRKSTGGNNNNTKARRGGNMDSNNNNNSSSSSSSGSSHESNGTCVEASSVCGVSGTVRVVVRRPWTTGSSNSNDGHSHSHSHDHSNNNSPAANATTTTLTTVTTKNVLLVTHGDALRAVLGYLYPARIVYEAQYLSFLVLVRRGSGAHARYRLQASHGIHWIVDGDDEDEDEDDGDDGGGVEPSDVCHVVGTTEATAATTAAAVTQLPQPMRHDGDSDGVDAQHTRHRNNSSSSDYKDDSIHGYPKACEGCSRSCLPSNTPLQSSYTTQQQAAQGTRARAATAAQQPATATAAAAVVTSTAAAGGVVAVCVRSAACYGHVCARDAACDASSPAHTQQCDVQQQQERALQPDDDDETTGNDGDNGSRGGGKFVWLDALLRCVTVLTQVWCAALWSQVAAAWVYCVVVVVVEGASWCVTHAHVIATASAATALSTSSSSSVSLLSRQALQQPQQQHPPLQVRTSRMCALAVAQSAVKYACVLTACTLVCALTQTPLTAVLVALRCAAPGSCVLVFVGYGVVEVTRSCLDDAQRQRQQ